MNLCRYISEIQSIFHTKNEVSFYCFDKVLLVLVSITNFNYNIIYFLSMINPSTRCKSLEAHPAGLKVKTAFRPVL